MIKTELELFNNMISVYADDPYVIEYKKLKVRPHFLDKFLLRDLFWFIVLPYNFKVYTIQNKLLVKLLEKIQNKLLGKSTH